MTKQANSSKKFELAADKRSYKIRIGCIMLL